MLHLEELGGLFVLAAIFTKGLLGRCGVGGGGFTVTVKTMFFFLLSQDLFVYLPDTLTFSVLFFSFLL